MEFIKTIIPDLILIKPKLYRDERGIFIETYRQDVLQRNGIHVQFIQDNQSISNQGVLRGLHFQIEPYAQAKLVRVAQGAVFDVAVDIRPNSPYFGKWVGEILSEKNQHMLFIPSGFAHGFLALENNTIFLYKCSNFYSPQHERGIVWNDLSLKIAWPSADKPFMISDKDQKFPNFSKNLFL